MNQRSKGTSRSTFYRGISLQDYFRSTPPPELILTHRYEETSQAQIDKISPQIEKEFVLSTPEFVHGDDSIMRRRNGGQRRGGTPLKSLQLPCMSIGKQSKYGPEGQLTQRNSTDTSLGSELEQRIPLLPNIHKKVMIRQRNITMASRQESSEPSCRKKMVEMRRAAQPHLDQSPSSPTKLPENKKYVQQIKKQISGRERRNIRQNIKLNTGNSKYFERVMSYNQ